MADVMVLLVRNTGYVEITMNQVVPSPFLIKKKNSCRCSVAFPFKKKTQRERKVHKCLWEV